MLRRVARVLFLTSSYPASPDDGVCGYVHDLARTLVDAHGHEVRVLAPAGRGATDDAAFAPVRVERFRHPWPLGRRLSADADMGAAVAGSRAARVEAASFTTALAARARRVAREADLVCSHWLVPAGVVGSSLGRPHVAVAHGGDVHLLSRVAWGARVARRIAARDARVVCVSRDLARRFVALAPTARPEVIAMGAEIGPAPEPGAAAALRDELGAGDRTVVLFLGRLVRVKGADTLLDAAARVPRVAVWIAGDGPELERLRERARAARLDVSFLGRVDRRRRRLALEACDAVVVPSRIERGRRAEGAPVVCAESYAAGRPVIATGTGGIVDTIDDERTGLLVPPDDPAALAAALARFAADADLRRRLGANAASRATEYSMATTAERFQRLFEGLEVGR
jgi:phosphatidyl-myo-inositol dimannoside synthase